MKKIIFPLFAFFLLFNTSIFSQDDALDIETVIEKVGDNEYEIIFDVYIEEDWHLYSQYNPEGASAPLKIIPAEGQSGFKMLGKAKESKTHTEYSDTWDKDEIFFKDEAEIIQRIKIEDPSLKKIKISFVAQVCLEFCLPYEKDFEFEIDNTKSVATKEDVVAKTSKKESKPKKSNTKIKAPKNLKGILFIVGFGLLGGLIAFFATRKKKK